MAVQSYKDILILILSIIVLLLGGYVVFDKFHTVDNNQNNNLGNLNYTNTPINNYSINNNISYTNHNKNNELNISDNKNEFTNDSDDITYIDYSKNIPLDDLFMDLPYSNVIDISEGYKKGKIKTYIKNGITINFDVRNYKPNLDNPEYVKVSKTKIHNKYGDYYKYTYTSEYKNSTLLSYCYYKKIGNYHIIMEFSKVNKDIDEIWLKWNKHIYNLYKKN